MWSVTCFLALLSLAAGQYSYNDIHYVPGHNTMVHLFEWKWKDIAKECEEFLGPIGYGGVQVSPVQENVIVANRPWWERYQPMSYHLVTRSGNREDFIDMVRRCNKAGVRIYVDVILNHMTGDHATAIGTGGSTANTYTRNYYGVSYNVAHFNSPCSIVNYDDPVNARNCELSGLHDLNQRHEHVRAKIIEFLNDLISIGVAGFRVDAAKHMWPADLGIIYGNLQNLNEKHGFPANARPFIVHEVYDSGNKGISKYEYTRIGSVTEFKYGTELSNAMRGNNPLKWLVNWGEEWGFAPSRDSFVFVDNHDTQRNSDGSTLTYKSSKLYKMAVAFMLSHPHGLPRVMSSFDFNDFNTGPPADANGNILSPEIRSDNTCGNGWICEHRWRQIYNMARFRNVVNGTSVNNWWDNGNNQIAFCRGSVGFVAFNIEQHDMKVTLKSCLPPGKYCDVISGNLENGHCTGKIVTVDNNGQIYVEILSREMDGVLAIHHQARLP